MTTLQDFAFNLTKASGEPMKAAAIAYAVLTARAMLPKDNPARIDPREARLAVENLEKADDKIGKKDLTSGVKATFEADMTNENTIAAVVATFPKLHTTLEKQYGKASGAIAATVGDDGANGEAGFWSSVLYTENHTDMVATVMAALKTNASPYTTEVWDGTWSGLRAYVGFKPAKKKTALMKLSAALKKAEKDILADELNAREAVFGIPDTDIVGIALFVAGLRGEIIADVIAAANNVLTTRKALAAMPVATDAELGIAA